jgi:adenine-specific DNA-methyltransferase
VIKYLGSKRTLVPVLGELAHAAGARTAADLFTGTTRVAQEFKQRGLQVTASDIASYSFSFSKTWVEIDARTVNPSELNDAVRHLNSLNGEAGYFTNTFCEEARFFQPRNGMKVDEIRNEIEKTYKSTWMYHPLLSALILAADRVDSTTGQHMAYLKNWAARSKADLKLRTPDLLPGSGQAIQGDAVAVADQIGPVDLVYLDPPYNQLRYDGNYHIWETLVRWDDPEFYGVANKRIDIKDAQNKSRFNAKREAPIALAELLTNLQAETVILSINNESWINLEQLSERLSKFGEVAVLDFDFKRYVGSKIGIYDKKGIRVADPSHHTNVEHLFLAGPRDKVARMKSSVGL